LSYAGQAWLWVSRASSSRCGRGKPHTG